MFGRYFDDSLLEQGDLFAPFFFCVCLDGTWFYWANVGGLALYGLLVGVFERQWCFVVADALIFRFG